MLREKQKQTPFTKCNSILVNSTEMHSLRQFSASISVGYEFKKKKTQLCMHCSATKHLYWNSKWEITFNYAVRTCVCVLVHRLSGPSVRQNDWNWNIESVPLKMFIQNHFVSTEKQNWALRRLRCQRQQFVWFEYSNRIENFTCSEWKNNKPKPIRSLVGLLPSALFACIAVVHQADDVLQMLARLKQSNKKFYSSPKRLQPIVSSYHLSSPPVTVCAPRLCRWRWKNGMHKSKWLTIRFRKFSAWTQRTHNVAFEHRMAKIICDAISDIRYLHYLLGTGEWRKTQERRRSQYHF